MYGNRTAPLRGSTSGSREDLELGEGQVVSGVRMQMNDSVDTYLCSLTFITVTQEGALVE